MVCIHNDLKSALINEHIVYKCVTCGLKFYAFPADNFKLELGRIAEDMLLPELIEAEYEFAIELQSRVNGL